MATVSPNDLAFIQAHTLPVVMGLKPRLAVAKGDLAAGRPVCTIAPAVTGPVGSVLTCAPGTWLNAPTYAYQWRRRGVANIPAATATTYTLVAGDSGYLIECQVTATNGAGPVTARSNAISAP